MYYALFNSNGPIKSKICNLKNNWLSANSFSKDTFTCNPHTKQRKRKYIKLIYLFCLLTLHSYFLCGAQTSQ